MNAEVAEKTRKTRHYLLVRAVAAAAVAAVTAALKVVGGEDHRAVFEGVVFSFEQYASQ